MEIKIIKNVMQYNKEEADANRELLKDNKTKMINILSSPGAGKTSLIIETIIQLKDLFRIGVIEGDIASTYDSEKIKKFTDNVVQINTGGTCHLNASMVAKALKELNARELDIIFVENVGNLICPVGFDLGENYRVLVSSVSEGDDKPIKYPKAFIKNDLILLNKLDLLENSKIISDFNLDFFIKNIKEINNNVEIIKISCKTKEGFESWISWLKNKLNA